MLVDILDQIDDLRIVQTGVRNSTRFLMAARLRWIINSKNKICRYRLPAYSVSEKERSRRFVILKRELFQENECAAHWNVLFLLFKTIGKIIVISPVGINKTGRNIDDDPFIGKRRIHLNPVDIIPVYEDNVVRFQRICLSSTKYCTLPEIKIVILWNSW